MRYGGRRKRDLTDARVHMERKNQMTAIIGVVNSARTYVVDTHVGAKATIGKATIVAITIGTIATVNL